MIETEETHEEISAPLLDKQKQKEISSNNSNDVSSSSQSENSPIEQVALTVPITDDSTLPVVTFRMWILGTLTCILLSFLNQFFWFRREPLSISSISAQIAVVPLGHLMAMAIPNRVFFKGRKFEFTMNPGPFNVKEHVLITIFANSGAGNPYAIHIVSAVKVFYKRRLTFWVSLIVVLTTQVLGFGWAGLFRKYLVEPAAMWWPHNLVQVSLFRALHEKEERAKNELTRNQFFLIAFLCSFAYYVFPGYLFPMLSSLSWLCWLFPASVLAQQLGSGLHGLGMGAIGLDWSSISSYLGSPLTSPWFATANIAAGYFLIMYVVTPIIYWSNVYKAKTFPIFSDGLFTSDGQTYNISAIVDQNFHIDFNAYDHEGPLYLSTFFSMTYAFSFACLSATVVHVFLFHGRDLWQLSKSAFQEKKMDIHTKLMRKYKQVPEWWFLSILLVNIAATVFICEYYKTQLQLPWWGVLLACGLAFFFTLPVGVITATTNQTPGLNVITEYIIGYLYPGYPVANMCFKVYGYISMKQGLTFLQDLKLGHYMKIPPRAMFMAQVAGTLISALVHLGAAWWLIDTVPDICDRALLPPGSPWTCPGDHVFYDASVIWGLIGPQRIFGNLGHYSALNWSFLFGAIAPVIVWIAHKTFPSQQWIRLITVPVLLAGIMNMPPATSVNYNSWIIIAFLSGFVVYRYNQKLWSRHNYVLSGALDAGLAFMGVLLYLCLGMEHVRLDWWGSDADRCPLAKCPTAQGIVVKGCPEVKKLAEESAKMEANSGKSTTNASSLRWKILRRNLIRRSSSNSEDKSEMGIQRISRKATHGFNLIPFHLMKDCVEENVNPMDNSRNATLCYTLPVTNASQLILHQRADDMAHLNDFEVCNRYDIDNTGLVCQWPSEDVLAHYCLSHASIFRGKRVIELGSGYGLAGLIVAMTTEARDVFISDGNPQVVDYIQRNVNANSGSFGGTEVKPLMLHWGQEKDTDIANTVDVIIASDCTFFKEFHGALIRTIKSLLKEEGPSEAILFSPRRGNSLDKFLGEVKDSGLHFSTDEMYDEEVWRRHQGFVEGDDSWPNYEMDHCYPLLVRITR